jgi:hypothetical protein
MIAVPALETIILTAVDRLNPKAHWDQAKVLKQLLDLDAKDQMNGVENSPKVAKRLTKALKNVTSMDEYLGHSDENRSIAGSAH